jgi:hypothetical protein
MTHISLELDRVAYHQHVIRAADYHFERAAGYNQIFDGPRRVWPLRARLIAGRAATRKIRPGGTG